MPYAALAVPVGEPGSPGLRGWAVDEPLGTDLIVGIASSVPLFRSPRPASEALVLRELRVALHQAVEGGARVWASVLVVRTGPKH